MEDFDPDTSAVIAPASQEGALYRFIEGTRARQTARASGKLRFYVYCWKIRNRGSNGALSDGALE